MRPALLALSVALLATAPLSAQSLAEAPRSVASALPPRARHLLEITRALASESPLGDLVTRETGAGDVELRYWGGFDASGTAGIVLRREDGAWKGWSVTVISCRTDVPASAAGKCSSVAPGDAPSIGVETLALVALKPDLVEAAWEQAVEAGAPILPPTIPRSWLTIDGYAHVVEVRIGKAYRASVIECAIPPRSADDYRVQKVAGVFARAFPSVRIACTR